MASLRGFGFGNRNNNNNEFDLESDDGEEGAVNNNDIIETHNANMNNIFVTDLLKAYPVALKNHNKVVLPQSLFKELVDKKIWDNRNKDRPLIFELSVADPDTADVLEETYVGVDNFTAPTGKIGLPYKTALSLAKERGIGWLHENPLISVRLAEIKESPQTVMKVQPRGKGFFLEDESVVQLDIRTVLELTLKDHLVLCAGDWIPLFWDGNRFELVVKDLQPENVIDVLNTDLTVEMLPSEETEQSMLEKEKAEKRVKEFMEYRETRSEELNTRYKDFKEADKKGPDSVTFRVRLPKGGQMTKTLNKNDELAVLIDLIDIELYKKNFVPMHLPPEGLNFFFNIIHALPGKGKTVIETNENALSSIKDVLEDHELTGKRFVFSLTMIKEQEDDEDEKKHGIVYLNNDWLKMADRLETFLQETEDEVEMMDPEEAAEIAEKLIGVGTEKALADRVARLYGKQVNELINMGYGEKLPRAAQLLSDKRGDLQLVLNTILQEDFN